MQKKKISKSEKQLRKLQIQGWKIDKYYICKEAFDKDKRVVYAFAKNGLFFCTFCGEEIISVQDHFYIGGNFNNKKAA